MRKVDHPGVYIEETGSRPKPIEGVPTSTAAFLGECGRGKLRPQIVTSLAEYDRRFGSNGPFLPAALRGFFANGGRRAFVKRVKATGPALAPDDLVGGLAALETPECEEVALVAAPGLVEPAMTGALIAHCEALGRFAVIDCPRAAPGSLDPRSVRASRNAACYAPWLETADGYVPPSGHVLGIYARVDVEHGVWKAPANEIVQGAVGLEHEIGKAMQEIINPRGVNVIRAIKGRGIRVWGARTLSTDREWQYVSIRRFFLYLERSIDRGTKWVVFKPNAEPLWARVRQSVSNFLLELWRAGALAGAKPQEAFFVACGPGTMTQDDILNGRLVCEIGIAPVRPAEFVIIRIGQWTSDAGDPP